MSAPVTELPDAFRPLRREEYDRLVELGVFEGMRIELVGGVLVEMSPTNPPHQGMVLALTKILVFAAGDAYVVGSRGPLAVDEVSEPQPDLVVLPADRDYHRVLASDALLVVEVADSSLRFDLGEKARRYAMAGYPEYWVVDVAARLVHVHRAPRPEGTWGSVGVVRSGRLAAVAAPAVVVDLDDLLA